MFGRVITNHAEHDSTTKHHRIMSGLKALIVIPASWPAKAMIVSSGFQITRARHLLHR
jgi:hypothetical protein